MKVGSLTSWGSLDSLVWPTSFHAQQHPTLMVVQRRMGFQVLWDIHYLPSVPYPHQECRAEVESWLHILVSCFSFFALPIPFDPSEYFVQWKELGILLFYNMIWQWRRHYASRSIRTSAQRIRALYHFDLPSHWRSWRKSHVAGTATNYDQTRKYSLNTHVCALMLFKPAIYEIWKISIP